MTRRGFSLVEVLAALAIAGLLAAWAVQSLPALTQRARRAAAMAGLLELALRQEAYRARHGVYACEPAALGWPPETDGSLPWPDPQRAWYRLRLHGLPTCSEHHRDAAGGAAEGAARGAAGYRAEALPAAWRGRASCELLIVEPAGARSAEASPCR